MTSTTTDRERALEDARKWVAGSWMSGENESVRVARALLEMADENERLNCDKAVEIGRAMDAEEANATLSARIEELTAENARLRDALGEIAWSNDSKWQSDRARAVLTPTPKPDKENDHAQQ